MGDDSIAVLSARPLWITPGVQCRVLAADRVAQFMREMDTDLRAQERENIGTALREILMKAIEHGSGLDAGKGYMSPVFNPAK